MISFPFNRCSRQYSEAGGKGKQILSTSLVYIPILKSGGEKDCTIFSNFP